MKPIERLNYQPTRTITTIAHKRTPCVRANEQQAAGCDKLPKDYDRLAYAERQAYVIREAQYSTA